MGKARCLTLAGLLSRRGPVGESDVDRQALETLAEVRGVAGPVVNVHHHRLGYLARGVVRSLVDDAVGGRDVERHRRSTFELDGDCAR